MTRPLPWLVAASALAGGCGRCNEAQPTAAPAAPTAVATAPPATPSTPGSSSATPASTWAPKGTKIPPELHGPALLTIEEADGQDALAVLAVEAEGAGAPRTVLRRPHGELTGGALSRDGKAVAFVSYVVVGDKVEPSVHVVGVDGQGERKVHGCDHGCEIAGWDARGGLWFVDRGPGDFPTIEVLRAGDKTATAWGPAFSPCNASHIVLSPDGTRVLVTVDDSFGWPECIDSKRQGVFVSPVDSKSLDASKPLLPFSKRKDSKGMNLNFAEAGFSPDGARLELEVTGMGDDDPDASTPEPDLPWTCKLDGSDARHEALAPRWGLVVVQEGKSAFVAARVEGKDTKAIAVFGPARSIGWVARGTKGP